MEPPPQNTAGRVRRVNWLKTMDGLTACLNYILLASLKIPLFNSLLEQGGGNQVGCQGKWGKGRSSYHGSNPTHITLWLPRPVVHDRLRVPKQASVWQAQSSTSQRPSNDILLGITLKSTSASSMQILHEPWRSNTQFGMLRHTPKRKTRC